MENLRNIGLSELEDFVFSDYYIEPSVIEVGSPADVRYNYLTKLMKSKNFSKNDYLSIYAYSEGDFNYSGGSSKPIEYSLNNDAWVTYTEPVSLKEADVLRLRGNNTVYDGTNINYTGNWLLYGDIKSLINPNEADEFRVTSFSQYVFRGLFANNYGLLSIIYLSIPSTASYGCTGMFENCSNLIDVVDELHVSSGYTYCFNKMFKNCSSILSASNLVLTVNGSRCCQEMFYGCSKLKSIPKLNIESLESYCFDAMFQGCIALGECVEEIDFGSGYSYCARAMYKNCESLKTVTKIKGILKSSCCKEMFYGCNSIETLPDDYFSNVSVGSDSSSEDYVCQSMFEQCTHLKNCPNLIKQQKIAGYYVYNSMFKDCTSLTSVGAIPTWYLEGSGMCSSMFENCINLEQSPAIFTTSISTSGAFSKMFYNCKKLHTVYCLISNQFSSSGFSQWLTGVADSGTIYLLEGSTLPTGENGIPETWNVQQISYSEIGTVSSLPDEPEFPINSLTTQEELKEVWDWWNWFYYNSSYFIDCDNRISHISCLTSGSSSSESSWEYPFYHNPIGGGKLGTYQGTSIIQKSVKNSNGAITYKALSNPTYGKPKLLITNVHFPW